MRSYVAGTDVTLSVAFLRNESPVLPGGSVPYTVLDQMGVVLLPDGVMEFGPTDFATFVSVPAALNAISTSFGTRVLRARAATSAGPIEARVVYRLLPEMNWTVEPADVRNYLGVREHELPDDDIDLGKSFLELQILMGKDALGFALTSGEETQLRANDALLYHAAIALIPSLELRIANKEQDGQISFQRNTKRDYSLLLSDTKTKLADAIGTIVPANEVSYFIFTTTADADPVTG